MDLKKVSLTIGIAVLFALFIGFFIDAVYPGPEYDQFCKHFNGPTPIYKGGPEPSKCPEINYNDPVSQECNEKGGYMEYDYDAQGCATNSRCNTCNKEFEAVNKVYSRNLFFITAIVGIIAILVGLIFVKLDAIASGFMFGGILVLIYGTARVFGDLSKVMRVIVLGIELIVLVYIGIKKSKK